MKRLRTAAAAALALVAGAASPNGP